MIKSNDSFKSGVGVRLKAFCNLAIAPVVVPVAIASKRMPRSKLASCIFPVQASGSLLSIENDLGGIPRQAYGTWGRIYYPAKIYHSPQGDGESNGVSPNCYPEDRVHFYADLVCLWQALELASNRK
jgi:hypothetical protein